MKKMIKKAQYGKDVPKGYVRGEMTGKLYKEKDAKAWQDKVTKSMDDEYFSRPENAKYKKAPAKAPVKPVAKPAPKKKMKDGGSLGMKSVKAGFDKNPGVTRADVIVAAKGKAKYGKKMVKKSK
jgi:hypothetical protein